MSEKIVVPTLGESVTEATVAKWLKNKGDQVSSDEPLVELETDKVNVEVPSPSNGILDSITANEGETVNVGALLGSITQTKSTSSISEKDLDEKKYSPPKLEKNKKEKISNKITEPEIKTIKQVESLALNEETNKKVFDDEPLVLEEEPLVLEETYNENKKI